MKPQSIASSLCGAVCAALLAFAFAAAPWSCEGGLEAYLIAGLVGIAVLLGIPFAFRTDASATKRLAIGAAFAALGLGCWFAGLFVANVRILCRLF